MIENDIFARVDKLVSGRAVARDAIGLEIPERNELAATLNDRILGQPRGDLQVNERPVRSSRRLSHEVEVGAHNLQALTVRHGIGVDRVFQLDFPCRETGIRLFGLF
ncbi:hypothetical protein DTW90_12145 [Neorhizobium sp. P12A]|uniref:hypothetical protein n=1 Tax=Neorhizobium sp. P12A TaxID=2268027 RepID=UPI0011EF07B0|nr:hypothetical protein [Neorhizobium sp. P12A]KAA0698550.1 hypothetical protein DTW90_12145 [Neorhizobium sp. P12A]